MQTFLPYPDFYKSADCLDWQFSHNRLNNQINEGIVIAKSLLGMYPEGKGWNNHPATKMWKGYELSLINYTLVCLERWNDKKMCNDINRLDFLASIREDILDVGMSENYPDWFGNDKFHSAHRSILLAKMPQWYSQFGWTETPAVKDERGRWPYYWPVK